MSKSFTNTMTEVKDRITENTEIAAIQNEAKNVTLWIPEGAADFDVRCHFWCSKDGEIPIQEGEKEAETEVVISPEMLQEIVSAEATLSSI